MLIVGTRSRRLLIVSSRLDAFALALEVAVTLPALVVGWRRRRRREALAAEAGAYLTDRPTSEVSHP